MAKKLVKRGLFATVSGWFLKGSTISHAVSLSPQGEGAINNLDVEMYGVVCYIRILLFF
jgi:hypothetical protein